MQDINIPIAVTGPGTQSPEGDGAELDLQRLPSEMSTYAMPEVPEADAVAGLSDGLQLLEQLQRQLADWADGPRGAVLDLTRLDAPDRKLIDQVLGEGEVSIVSEDGLKARIQESVLAGVWRAKYFDELDEIICDAVEVGPVPLVVSRSTFAGAATEVILDETRIPEAVLNALPLVAEINDRIGECRPGDPPHVINLTLLPQTEADLEFLSQRLGKGPVAILSRGYGNCRITSTGTRDVWWVQYFNSQDANILNTLEIVEVPAVACAAPEDIAESASRLDEILDIYR